MRKFSPDFIDHVKNKTFPPVVDAAIEIYSGTLPDDGKPGLGDVLLMSCVSPNLVNIRNEDGHTHFSLNATEMKANTTGKMGFARAILSKDGVNFGYLCGSIGFSRNNLFITNKLLVQEGESRDVLGIPK
jgi:hypothetical protein